VLPLMCSRHTQRQINRDDRRGSAPPKCSMRFKPEDALNPFTAVKKIGPGAICARRSTLCLIDDHVAFAKESVGRREDRVLAGPDLPLTERYAQRTSSHAKSFCVFQYDDRRIHNIAFSACDQADPFGCRGRL